MKKLVPLVALLLVFHVSLIAGETRHTYTFGNPVVIKTGSYQLIEFDNTLQTGLVGEPTLPYCKVDMLLAPGESATRIEYQWNNEITIPGTFVLFPQQQVRPISQDPSGIFLKNESLYAADIKYPGNAGGHLVTSFLNGRSLALSTFTPVRYNPATGQVSYFESVTVTVYSSSSPESREAMKNFRTGNEIESRVKKLVDNPEAATLYSSDDAAAADDYQVLVITTSAFSNSFSSLVDHYLMEGMACQIMTTEEINTSVSGNDLQEKIRNYITSEYQQHGVEHVILGGDDELVPHRGLYCFVQSSSAYEDQNIPADIYYSGLDGNWNTDGDSQWGEPGEDDLEPDISVGRMPFSTLNELNAMLNKTVSYQFTPVLGEMRQVLMAGEHLYDNPNTNGSQYIELLIGDHSDNGYTTSGIPENYDFDKMYDEVESWSGSDLMNHLNQGRPMLNHSGHANETFVMKFNNSDITDANFSQVNGTTHNFTVVYTHGCLCGAFDYNDCIAEKMVTINNFAAAFVGNSRYGWFNEGQTEGPSAHLHREFMDALFTDHYTRIGHAHMESKCATAPWVTAPGQWEPGALRWCFYDCNLLGDPAMAMWTDNPFNATVTYSQAIPVGITTTSVSVHNNGQPAPDVTCAIVKNGLVVGKGITSSTGTADIIFNPAVTEPGPATLYVSGGNSMPASYTLEFIPSTGAYIVYQSVTVNDATGNQDGIPDYGETVSLSLTVQNNGAEDATNVTVTVTSDDPYVTFTDSTELYPSVPVNSWVTIDNGFTFVVSDSIPDMHNIIFNVTATSGNSWYSTFSLTAHAPLLVTGNLSISNESLAQNGRLDPGETATVNIPVSNQGHSDCRNMTASLASDNSSVTIANPSITLGNLQKGGTVTASFQTEVGATIPMYSLVELDFTAGSGNLSVEEQYYQLIGVNVEDFETGDFTKYNWDQGDHPWMITSESTFEGDYSARSGVIADGETSQFSITMEVLASDSISFYSKVSCEDTFDKLSFSVNQQEKDAWSGELPWEHHSYMVEAGMNTFKWSYTKDFHEIAGSDCAWVDYIIFPAFRNNAGVDEKEIPGIDLCLYPNPASGELHIKCSHLKPGDNTLSIIAADGRICYKQSLTGSAETVVNTSSLKSGIYECIISNGSVHQVSRAFIIR